VRAPEEGAVAKERHGVEPGERFVVRPKLTKRPLMSNIPKNPLHQHTVRTYHKYEIRMDLPLALFQREALRHIPDADDEIELERERLRILSIRNDEIEETPFLDVLDLMLGRDEGVAFGAEGVGEEDCVEALCW
jgi:hypothetical protein